MIEALKSWIINICAVVIFLTAVELVLPDNSMKKYTRFALGLILITVVLNPIVQVLSKGTGALGGLSINANSIFGKNADNKSYAQYKEDNIKYTLDTFKNNLEVASEKELKNKFPQYICKVEVEVFYEDKTEAMKIKSASVGVKGSGIAKVQKVQPVGKKGSETDKGSSSEVFTSIKEYMSQLLDIPKESISIKTL